MLQKDFSLGKVAYRHPKDGSWYIQTLCHILREHALSMSFTDMLLKLNYIIAEKNDKTYDKDSKQMSFAKQMSSMRYNTLRKPLYFNPKGLYIEEAFRNTSLNQS